MYEINYFPGPHTHSKDKIEVALDLSFYAKKSDLKNATGFDISDFAKIADLGSLKSNAGKLDIDKLKYVPSGLNNLKSNIDKLYVDKLTPAPVDLSKLSNVVKK